MTTPSDHRIPIRLLAFVLALTALRLVLAAAIHPTEDEAYYRLWAAGLQAGYYDHPPMIAWWIRLGQIIAGDTPLGLRLIPVLASAIVTLLVFDLAKRLGLSIQSAERASVWYSATLLAGLGANIATPDSAATLFWICTACCLIRTEDEGEEPWWIAVGVSAGLACLSKYSALFLAPGAVGWLLWRYGPKGLLRPWPWAAVLIAAAVFSPNILWNAANGWEAFSKQFGRVAATHFRPSLLVEFLVSEALLLNPLITPFAVAGLIGAFRKGDGRGRNPLLPLIFLSVPFAVYLCLHSLHDRVQAHWPTPLFPGLAICAACAAERAKKSLALMARAAVAPFGLGLTLLALAHMALPVTDHLGGKDPVLALRNWPQFDAQVDAMRVAHGAAWVGGLSYGTTAQMQVDKGINAPVLQVSERHRYPAVDRSWSADMTRPGLLIDLLRRMELSDLKRCFASVTFVGEIDRDPDLGSSDRYGAYLVSGPLMDVLHAGCWESKSIVDDALKFNARAAN